MAKQVLVAGASGFVGSRLTEALESEGYSVLAMTRHPDTLLRRWQADLRRRQRTSQSSLGTRRRRCGLLSRALARTAGLCRERR